jgi:hypothetical protein
MMDRIWSMVKLTYIGSSFFSSEQSQGKPW